MKRVRVKCYEPIAVDPMFQQPWADVWIRFKTRPGRPALKYGPTLISRPELRSDIECEREETDVAGGKNEEVELLERIDAFLDTQPVYVDGRQSEGQYPNVYTSAAWIDRGEAERMLQALMNSLGYGQAKFLWKRERFVVQPISLARG